MWTDNPMPLGAHKDAKLGTPVQGGHRNCHYGPLAFRDSRVCGTVWRNYSSPERPL